MKAFLVRGVPPSVQHDSWWVSSPPQQGRSHNDADAPHPLAPFAMLVALVICGDALLWSVSPVASLALFATLIVLGAWAVQARRLGVGQTGQVISIMVLAMLPVLEHLSALSFAWLVLGTTLALLMLADVPLRQLPGGVLRWMQWAPVQLGFDALRMGRASQRVKVDVSPKSLALGWALPLGLGLVFVSLLIDANPMLSDWFDLIQAPNIDIGRLIFWIGLMIALWPCLSVLRMRARLNNPISVPMPATLPQVFNQASVTRSLVLFNLIFALQTGLDVTYLYSGFALPDGMTYAEYAHRGAYPLIVTALLAGAFALLTRRFTQDAPLLRIMLLFWVAQNVLLVVSSIYRLELYVEVYGLTHLRIAAFLWMGVVALGLMLTLWQIWKMREAAWLLARASLLGAGVLYGACFIDFDKVIAEYNTTHPVQKDTYYMCRLSASATPVLLAYQAQNRNFHCHQYGYNYYPEPRDWREWGFRSARVRHSVDLMKREGL